LFTYSKDEYQAMVKEGIIINTIAVILIALGILVPFAIRRTNSPASFKVYVTETIWGQVKVHMAREITEITVTEPDAAENEKY
jgi:uncharacterized membrane protein